MMRTFPRARWAALASILVLTFLSGGWLLRPRPAAEGGIYEQARLFEGVVGAINRHYIDSLGEGDLYQRAADALVGSLRDPYAELLVKDAYHEYQRQMAGTEVDIERGPSESGWEGRLGGSLIAPGDEVLSIDGQNTDGWSDERLDEALRRGTGPTVTVVVRPRGGTQPVIRRFTRTEIHVPAASRGILLAGDVGYVVLRRMSQGAAEELRASVDTLVSQGMTSLVLDLRSNPGGLIREGVAIAGLFLEPGDTVATSIGRSSKRTRTYLADAAGGWDELRVVALVNRGTASSAELVAGALQDHDRAVVVGTPTYGKGVLQTTYPIGEDVALKLTTARWYTPSGRTVQRPRPDSAGGPGNRIPATQPRTFFTSRGRVVPDASGILPDLLVRAMPRSEGERLLAARLGEGMNRFRDVLAGYAAELRSEQVTDPDAAMLTAERRDALFSRMEDAGVRLDRETYDLAGGFVEEQLANELARAFFGSDSVLRRKARNDRQLQAALQIVRTSKTQDDALNAAMRAQLSGRIR
ncbi:MAG TPA: S41 family peptidase [Gemmatimonadales bacterium]|nr:S41 family peptidase [Gemmatimonadales bacterium]